MASYKTVIDVSKYNTVSSWSSVASKVDGVIIRAGYRGYGSSGTLTKDSKFASHISGAVAARIPVGVYFFTQAKTTSEAVAEADYCISLISGYKMSFPIFIDTEYANTSHTGRADSLSKSVRTNCVKAFCDEIIAKGYSAGVYASDAWFNDNLNLSSLTSYNLWVAKYSTTAPKYVSSYVGWQYTSSATVTGISGNVDMSKWYGDITAASVTESSSSSSSSSSTSTTTSSSSSYAAGDKLTLKNTNLYATASTTKASSTKTGTYYVWAAATSNGRIRITNSKANVGKSGQITGWVKVSDLSGTSSTTTTMSSSSSSSSSSTTSLTTGAKVTLKATKIYGTSSTTKVSSTKSGTFYIWSNTQVNKRIRITTTKANVGKAGQITGWVNVSDIS